MNRRAFLGALTATAVALKIVKPSDQIRMGNSIGKTDHELHSALHYADLRANDWVDIYALDDHPHLTKANEYAWRRHARQHELAFASVSSRRLM